jgi:photosystem II stability/assembly factor-like uncharacterized protein
LAFWTALAVEAANDFPLWRPIGPYGGSARAVVLDREKPETLLVLGMRETNLFRSRDGAGSWEHLAGFPLLPGARLDAALIVHAPQPVWLVGAAPGGLYRSLDEGTNWQVVAGTEGLSVYALGAWPKDERVLAAGTNQGVWLSHDAGASWRRASPKTIRDLDAIVSVAFHPDLAGTLYAGTPHLPWKTNDGGVTWKQIPTGMFDDSDIFSLAVDGQQPGRVFASACSGIYRSVNAGVQWQRVQGIPGTNRRTYVVRQSPHKAEVLFAGTSAGMWKSVDGGTTWKKQNEVVATSVQFHPRRPELLYISTERHGVLRSEDWGETFVAAHSGFVSRRVEAVMADPAAAGLLALANYEGNSGALFRSAAPGGAWQQAGVRYNFSILQSAGGRLSGLSMDGARLDSGDGGQSWAPASEGLSRPMLLPAGATDWAENPAVAGQWLAASPDGLLRSEDGGRSWKKITEGLGPGWVSSVAFHAKRKGLCFALRGQRVFWSNNHGQNWYWLPAKEEAHLPFRKLQTVAGWPDLLFALSESRGLFIYDLSENPLN